MSYLVRKRKKREEGFTLIELVIVIAIIGILMAIAIPNYMRAREAAAASATQANLRNLATALELYMAENNLSEYPPATSDDEDDINDALEGYFNGPAPTSPKDEAYLYVKTDDGFLIWDPGVYVGKGYSVGPGGKIITEEITDDDTSYTPTEVTTGTTGTAINFGHATGE